MSKVINLADRLAERRAREESRSITGYLIWLHCPTCNTIEYTEMQMEGGRIHKCGTLVEEKEIEIDVRAEFTISQRNLQRLQQAEAEQQASKVRKLLGGMGSLLQQLRAREEEYQSRLQKMTQETIAPYPETWDPAENGVEVTTNDPIGLQITSARLGHRLFQQES
jgi:hypothetical protein